MGAYNQTEVKFMLLAQLAIFAAEMTPIPPDITTPTYEPTFIKMILTFLGLIALIIGSIWILKRILNAPFRQVSSQKTVKILERKGLSPKSTLYVVELYGKKIVFVESQAEVRKLMEIEERSSEESRS